MSSANEVYRQYVTDGIPASGDHNPKKSEIRALLAGYESQIASFMVGDSITKKTWAQLSAIEGTRDGQRGFVEDDSGTHTDPVTAATVANAGVYGWVKASAAWQWLRTDDYAQITVDVSDLQNTAQTLQQDLSFEVTDRQQSITAEASARTNADTTLQQNIAAETSARQAALNTVTNALEDETTNRLNADTATNEKIDESLPVSDTASGAVPVITDDGKVIAFIVNGKLETIPRSDQQPFNGNRLVPLITDGGKVIAAIVNGKLETIPRVDQQPFNGNKRVPLITDGGKVLLWLETGFLHGAPASRSFARNVDIASSRAATHGASLNRWRAASAKYKYGEIDRLKIMLIGDSWVDQYYISSAIADVLGGSLAAEGFHAPVNGGDLEAPYFGKTNKTVFSKSGTWTVVDGSVETSFTYGIGPSGRQLWSDATDGVITLANFRATDISIYHHNFGGTWRYQIDGGTWTVVSDTSDELMDVVTISGLSDAEHTLTIDTTGNAGIVAIDGFYSWRDGATGYELIRVGNSGVTSVQQSNYHAEMVQLIEDVQPDIIFTILGTNDQFGTPPDNHYGAILDLVSRARAIIPDVGFIHIVPPQSDGASQGTVYFTQADYRDAIQRVVRDAGTEYLSMVDLLKDWDTENALGVWDNWGHLNKVGGRILADEMNDKFLKL